MVLIVLRGLNGQNNEGRALFDKGSTNREEMEVKRLMNEFPNSTTSLEYFLLRITVSFVVADGSLTSMNV